MASILFGLCAATDPPLPTVAASPTPFPVGSGAAVACDPAVGPALNSRFRGIGSVSLFNGVFSFDHVDLNRPHSIAATFSRGYISADTRSNNMGVGWSSNYGVRIRAFTSKDLVFTDAYGFTSKFRDAYKAPTTDVMKTMSLRPPPPAWVASDGSTTWTLDEVSGNLMRVETSDGESLDVHYEGDHPTDTIDPDRNGLRFKLDAKGRFVQVTDRRATKRWIKFAYDATGRLIQVDRPSGTTERYTYVGSTQQINTIANGMDESLLRIDYDQDGRVIKERDAEGLRDGQAVEFRYEKLPDEGVKTTVTYPQSRVDPLWHPVKSTVHDPNGNLLELVLQPTRGERFEGRYEYDDANKRIVLRDACLPAPTIDAPETLNPLTLLAAALSILALLIRRILVMF